MKMKTSLVINKAPGMVVHPGAGHAEGTLVHGLLAHCRAAGAARVLPCDRGSCIAWIRILRGLLLWQKRCGLSGPDQQFKDHTVEKHYLALVYGSFSQPSGQVTTSLGRHPADRKKIAVQKGKGRVAVTRWQVEKAWERGHACCG